MGNDKDFCERLREIIKSKENKIKSYKEKEYFEAELALLDLKNNPLQAETIYIHYLLSEFAKKNNEVFYVQGAIASSYIFYMLEITPFNPVDYNLRNDLLVGLDGKKPIVCDFVCSNVFKEKCILFLKETFNKSKVYKIESPIDQRNYVIIVDDELDLEECDLYLDGDCIKSRTDKNNVFRALNPSLYPEICFVEDEYIASLNKKSDKAVTPELSQLVKTFNCLKDDNKLHLIGLEDFNYKKNSDMDLYEIATIWCKTNVYYEDNNNIVGTIYSREQLLNILYKGDISYKLSYRIMEVIRKGKFARGMYKDYLKPYDFTDDFISDCKNIRYLYSLASALTFIYPLLLKAYFKCY